MNGVTLIIRQEKSFSAASFLPVPWGVAIWAARAPRSGCRVEWKENRLDSDLNNQRAAFVNYQLSISVSLYLCFARRASSLNAPFSRRNCRRKLLGEFITNAGIQKCGEEIFLGIQNAQIV